MTTTEVRAVVASVAPAVQHLADNDSLFDVGRIDSLMFLRILQAIEERYAMRVSDDDVAIADFSSIQAIAAYVDARRQESAGSG